jgi:hypothetical protein
VSRAPDLRLDIHRVEHEAQPRASLGGATIADAAVAVAAAERVSVGRAGARAGARAAPPPAAPAGPPPSTFGPPSQDQSPTEPPAAAGSRLSRRARPLALWRARAGL